MKNIILAYLLFLACLPIYGQNKKALDSLQKVYPKLKADTSRILTLIEIAYAYREHKPDTTLLLAEKALREAQKKHYQKGMAWAWNRIGGGHHSKNNYPKAMEYYQKALPIFEKIGEQKGVGSSLNGIGRVYDAQSNYTKALEYYQQSLDVEEKIGNQTGIANSLDGFGYIYTILGNYTKALEYIRRSLKIHEKMGNQEGIAKCLEYIGEVYRIQTDYPKAIEYSTRSFELYDKIGNQAGAANGLTNVGYEYILQGDYAKGLECNQRSFEMYKKLGNEKNYILPVANIGICYSRQGNYTKAIEYLETSLALSNKFEEAYQKTETLFEMAKVYQLQKDYPSAVRYAKESLALAEEKNNLLWLNQSSQVLYNIYKEQGNYAQALIAHEIFKKSQDSLFNDENVKKIKSIESKAEIDKRELILQRQAVEIQKQKEARILQQRIDYLIVGSLLIVLVLAFYLARLYKHQKQANRQVIEKNEEIKNTLDLVEIERAKSDKLLLNILPTEVAEELKETGKTDVRYFESVTVLFADVKGFSALATKVTPQALIAELDATFSKMDEISMRFGLERIKTIGDCYMACGGLPHANKTHPFDVVLTALNIQHWMNEERERRNGDFWQVRLGAHTGDAVASVIGKTKFAYDIWGSTINLASRMESGGEVGKVTITQQTFEIVQDYFEGNYREEIEAKNIGKVKAYSVSRLKPEFSADTLGFEPNERFWEVYRSL